MKKEPKVFLRLNVVDFSEKLKNILLKKLKKLLEENYGKKLKVNFSNAEEYWKIQGRTDCFFAIYASSAVSVKGLIETFNLDWGYTVGPTYNIDNPSEQIESTESAVWDKATDGGTLLHENVKWANIYTWSE